MLENLDIKPGPIAVGPFVEAAVARLRCHHGLEESGEAQPGIRHGQRGLGVGDGLVHGIRVEREITRGRDRGRRVPVLETRRALRPRLLASIVAPP